MAVQKPIAAIDQVMPIKFADLVVKRINQSPGIPSLSPVEMTTVSRLSYPLLDFVDFEIFATASGARKGTSGFDFDAMSVQVKKLATIWMAQDEALEDLLAAGINLEEKIRPKIAVKFSQKIDEMVLAIKDGVPQSYAAGVDWDVNLGNSTGVPTAIPWTVPAAAKDVANTFSLAVSAALAELELTNFDDQEDAIGMVLGRGYKQLVREAGRLTDQSDRLFASLNDMTYGVNAAYSKHLKNPLTATSGDTLAVIGRYDLLPILLRHDIRLKISNEATVQELADASIQFSAFQEDLTFFRYHTRAGAIDLTQGDGFVRITKA